MRWRSSLTLPGTEITLRPQAKRALSLLLLVRLELGLQGGQLGEGRIGIGIAVGALARARLGSGEHPRRLAAITTAIGPAVAALGAGGTSAAVAARAILAVAARARALRAGLAGLAILAATAATALRLLRGRRGRDALACCRRRAGSGCLAGSLLAARAARRAAVTARSAALIRSPTRPP